jgi:hypothetical protein
MTAARLDKCELRNMKVPSALIGGAAVFLAGNASFGGMGYYTTKFMTAPQPASRR